jgi:hypothetical protein
MVHIIHEKIKNILICLMGTSPQTPKVFLNENGLKAYKLRMKTPTK